MSKFEVNIKTKEATLFLLLSLCFVGSAFAGPTALVGRVEGNVFALFNGKAKTLHQGDLVEEFSEVMTEENSQVTITDYFDHQFHLSGGSHIKILKNGMDLRRGTMWIQSYSKDQVYNIQTANAVTDFVYGEAILSFDGASGKSQLFCINGNFQFKNVLDTSLRTDLYPGHFSFVDNEYNEGIPRKPTRIGYNSYKQITNKFTNVKSMSGSNVDFILAGKNSGPERGKLAGQYQMPEINVNKDNSSTGITFISNVGKSSGRNPSGASRSIASVSSSNSSKNPIIRKTWKNRVYRKSAVRVRVFDGKQKHKKLFTYSSKNSSRKKSVKSRAPASISKRQYKPKVSIPSAAFMKGFDVQYKKQKRHKEEVNSLIDELKSYQVDYRKEY